MCFVFDCDLLCEVRCGIVYCVLWYVKFLDLEYFGFIFIMNFYYRVSIIYGF